MDNILQEFKSRLLAQVGKLLTESQQLTISKHKYASSIDASEDVFLFSRTEAGRAAIEQLINAWSAHRVKSSGS